MENIDLISISICYPWFRRGFIINIQEISNETIEALIHDPYIDSL